MQVQSVQFTYVQFREGSLSCTAFLSKVQTHLLENYYASLFSLAPNPRLCVSTIKVPFHSIFFLSSTGISEIKIFIYSKFVCVFTQLCPTLCDTLNCSPSCSSVHEIFQARILEPVVISFSRGSS